MCFLIVNQRTNIFSTFFKYNFFLFVKFLQFFRQKKQIKNDQILCKNPFLLKKKHYEVKYTGKIQDLLAVFLSLDKDITQNNFNKDEVELLPK